jgi:hypothetical protein
MNKQDIDIHRPEILAPAGNRASFLAAVADWCTWRMSRGSRFS